MNGKPSTGVVGAAVLLAAWREAERHTAAAREAAGRSRWAKAPVEAGGSAPAKEPLSVAEAEAAEAAAKAAYHAAQERLFSGPRVTALASIGGTQERQLPS